MPYYVELVQEDPEGSPTPGSWHYAGEVSGFTTATEALVTGLHRIGKPVPKDEFHPCCDWQSQGTIVVGCIVYVEDENGNRAEDWSVEASLKKPNRPQGGVASE